MAVSNMVARLLCFVSVCERVLAAEILDMAEPVSKHALRQPVPEMRADPPEDHAEIVFRVRLDRQPADDDKTAPLLDLTADLVDDRRSDGSSKCARPRSPRPRPTALTRAIACSTSRSCLAVSSIV